jgi:hypothetical protein
MSFYDPDTDHDGFAIDLSNTSALLHRFHRTLMDRRQEIDWSFDPEAYDADLVEQARVQWSQRAVAEYQSTAQFAQLLHRLTLLGVPVEMIGAATRLATDECRHAELCARFADALGGCEARVTHDGLSMFDDAEGLETQCALTILTVCCFGETLSVPMLRALSVAATDPLAERVATIIAGDEEYHSRFGWEALAWFCDELGDANFARVEDRLPKLFGHFERVCHASPTVFERLAGGEVTIEEGDENLGTLPSDGYAAIFYSVVEETLLPGLTDLGFDARDAWDRRIVPRGGRQ